MFRSSRTTIHLRDTRAASCSSISVSSAAWCSTELKRTMSAELSLQGRCEPSNTSTGTMGTCAAVCSFLRKENRF